jgi:hypothetical protein
MGRLRLYVNAHGRCALYQSGFSWLAAVSLPVWALQRRLRVLAAIALILGLGIELVVQWLALSGSGKLALVALQFALSGSLANPLHRMLLERSGWYVTAEEPAAVAGATR